MGSGACRVDWSIVRPSLSELAHRPEIATLHSINVHLPVWDGMWAAYFLQSRMRVYLVGPSYFRRRSPPLAP